MSGEFQISDGIITIFAKSKFCTVQYIEFLTCLFLVGGWWGGGGDETFPKSFDESFAKILAKFHELKIFKKTTTLVPYLYRSSFLIASILHVFNEKYT